DARRRNLAASDPDGDRSREGALQSALARLHVWHRCRRPPQARGLVGLRGRVPLHRIATLKRWLVLFEDSHWRRLRPLTDVVPVSELKFGASTLGARLVQATKLPLLATEGRAGVRHASRTIKPGLAAQPAPDDAILALNSAAVPGAWLEEVLASPGPLMFHSGDRVLGAAFEARLALDVLGRDQEFENFLLARGFPVSELSPKIVDYPWQLIEWNAGAIAEDLAAMRPESIGTVHKQAVIIGPARVRIEAGASVDALAVIDSREGPVWIGAGAVVNPHALVRGPCVV